MVEQGAWNESLCGCLNDLESCLCGWCCTPCLFGRNAEKIDGSSCILMCCAYLCLTECYLCWIPHCMKRQNLRMKYGLREEPCSDCLTTCCCGPCALCQEARFLKRYAYPGGVFVTETLSRMPGTYQPSIRY